MPRQDVPYGGAICRLKERIAEIWDKLGEKLHSINGVEGDGAGNLNIVSGDAAITVSESPTGHFIEIGLDHGNLPSAAVSSVNGQTGAVRLDAADIPSDGNSNVQSDIAANKAAINDCFDSITSEQAARQSADAALQTNINTVQASIPEMSAAPDPYKGVERDAQGRAFAADPESGATDKTLVTANWVSQTGVSAPNNLIHRSGNEIKNGTLKLTTTTAGATSLKVEQTSNGPIIAMYALNYDLNQHEKKQYYPGIYMFDKNEVRAGGLYLLQEIDGRTKIIARVRNADGTTKEIAIAVGD